uniref:Ribosomal protein S7 n=1 Tax=Rhodomonas salina TaxID=3034 RepID=Q9G8T7_RHDSA|nr:ribosomal protein S7 [Rhodomonas salina]AAG17760.1 ribosomal protein S7 [Rhodomonas salina]
MVDQNMEQKSLIKEVYKTNLFLLKGSKENIEILFRKNCFSIKKQKKQNSIIQIVEGVRMIKPFYETKSMKTRSKVTQVPIEISRKRQQLLATKFLLTAVSEKKSSFLHNKLTNELIGIINLNANSLKIRENFQKNVETNKIFIQYRF